MKTGIESLDTGAPDITYEVIKDLNHHKKIKE